MPTAIEDEGFSWECEYCLPTPGFPPCSKIHKSKIDRLQMYCTRYAGHPDMHVACAGPLHSVEKWD